MKARQQWQFIPLAFALTAMAVVMPDTAHGQRATLPETHSATAESAVPNVIIIGFVGGFVSPDDTKHPEVQFAAYLRDRYPSIHVDVFGNHHGRKALNQVVRLLDTDHDGALTSIEKERATIIIYGHSWGASEGVALARELGKMGIPVALTIQVDTITKPGHKATAISPNVASAINFYQTGGPLHGRQEIVAADPEHTEIIGNIRMTYEDRPINCDNYSWYARTLNKPHHEIENDLRIWDEAAFLINANLPGVASTGQTPSPSRSPFFKYLKLGLQAHETETALLEVPSGEKINEGTPGDAASLSSKQKIQAVAQQQK
jgi:hypothetical protein